MPQKWHTALRTEVAEIVKRRPKSCGRQGGGAQGREKHRVWGQTRYVQERNKT